MLTEIQSFLGKPVSRLFNIYSAGLFQIINRPRSGEACGAPRDSGTDDHPQRRHLSWLRLFIGSVILDRRGSKPEVQIHGMFPG